MATSTAKLALISDFPIEERVISAVRQLWGKGTGDNDIAYSTDRRCCTWPCRVLPEGGQVRDIGFQVHGYATFLSQRRKAVERIHELGCNLELCVEVCGPLKSFSLTSATMKQLADLHVQLSFHPGAAASGPTE